jgi:transcriptional regulator with XRE-family HTH domain
MKEYMKQAVKELRAERKRQGLTQTELGRRAGLGDAARVQVARAEGGNGALSIDMLERMAAALGYSVEVTITVTPHPPK